MWPYSWTHVGTPSHLGHMDRVAATMPSQAHAGAAQEAPNIGQWEGQDVPMVRPSSCTVKGGIPSSRRYLSTYLSDRSCIHQTHSWSRRTDGCKGSCLHLPSPRLRDWVPDRAFRPRQSLCAYRLPTGMVRRFPRQHPETALAGALGCRGSARGRRLWRKGCSPPHQPR